MPDSCTTCQLLNICLYEAWSRWNPHLLRDQFEHVDNFIQVILLPEFSGIRWEEALYNALQSLISLENEY
jgi:hypothetical protein